MKIAIITILKFFWKLIPRDLQWRTLWITQPKFNVGIGIVVIDSGRILLVKNRVRTRTYWALPTGWMNKGEAYTQAASRELREETSVEVNEDQFSLLSINTGYQLRVEIFVAAYIGSNPTVTCGPEISESRFFASDSLPSDLSEIHRRMVDKAMRNELL